MFENSQNLKVTHGHRSDGCNDMLRPDISTFREFSKRRNEAASSRRAVNRGVVEFGQDCGIDCKLGVLSASAGTISRDRSVARASLFKTGARAPFARTIIHGVFPSRARQGMVIFVPPGDPTDPTRSPEFYDSTFECFRQLGITALP
jgi:hypothetical protein